MPTAFAWPTFWGECELKNRFKIQPLPPSMFSLWFDRELFVNMPKVLWRLLCEKKVIDLIQLNLDRTSSMRKFFQRQIFWVRYRQHQIIWGGCRQHQIPCGGGGIIFYIGFPGVGVVSIRFPGVGVINNRFPGVGVINIKFFHKGGCC